MTASMALELARSAAAERRWREACDRFTEARSIRPVGLSGPDLELLATASLLRGHPAEGVEAMTSAHDLYLAHDDTLGAARTAGWLALELLELGDLPLSGTWTARGLRLVERMEDSEAVGARVSLVPAALTGLFVGNLRRRFGGSSRSRRSPSESATANWRPRGFRPGQVPDHCRQHRRGIRRSRSGDGGRAAGDVSPSGRASSTAWSSMSRMRHSTFGGRNCGRPPSTSGAAHNPNWSPTAGRAMRIERNCCSSRRVGEASAAASLAEERLRAGRLHRSVRGELPARRAASSPRRIRAAEDHYQRAAERDGTRSPASRCSATPKANQRRSADDDPHA